MDLREFIEANEIIMGSNLINIDQVESVEEAVGVSFGGELVKYIVKYGFLIFEDIELYGVDARQMLDSDLVKQTIYLHKYFPKTKGYVALENQGDGVYAVVDANDEVFQYISETDTLKDTGKSFFQYILNRFQEAV